MKREILLLSNIKKDLKTILKIQMGNTGETRLAYIVPITLISIIVGVLLKNAWVALLIFSAAVYPIVLYIIEFRDYITKKKAIMNAIDGADISISTEKLSHIAQETIYEPHMVGKTMHHTKEATFYYFESGISWRIPLVYKHYKWSKDNYISSRRLKNISIKGDEFYVISLQGHHDIAYIYPCKFFEIEASLKKQP